MPLLDSPFPTPSVETPPHSQIQSLASPTGEHNIGKAGAQNTISPPSCPPHMPASSVECPPCHCDSTLIKAAPSASPVKCVGLQLTCCCQLPCTAPYDGHSCCTTLTVAVCFAASALVRCSAETLTMLAPGVSITAAGLTMSGTSQATPFVAASLALLRSRFPAYTNAQIVAALTTTGIPVSS